MLAKNFGVDEAAFDMPGDVGHTRYMFASKVPPLACATTRRRLPRD